METKTRNKTLSNILTVLAALVVFGIMFPFVAHPTSITKAYESAGVFAPLVFILLVMIAPTPGAVVGASGASYFGIVQGALYLFIGNLLGVSITFLLVQRFGRPLAQHFFKEEKLKQYEAFVHRHPFLQWFVYALPIFPIELVTFVIALSGKNFKDFFITVMTALPMYSLFVTTVGFYVSATNKQLFGYASLLVIAIIVYAILHFIYAWKRTEIHATGRMLVEHGSAAGRRFTTNIGEHVRRITRK